MDRDHAYRIRLRNMRFLLDHPEFACPSLMRNVALQIVRSTYGNSRRRTLTGIAGKFFRDWAQEKRAALWIRWMEVTGRDPVAEMEKEFADADSGN